MGNHDESGDDSLQSIPGAKKENRTWKLPADAERPVDHRFKEKTSGMATRARKVK